jgi:hypothetical protein
MSFDEVVGIRLAIAFIQKFDCRAKERASDAFSRADRPSNRG